MILKLQNRNQNCITFLITSETDNLWARKFECYIYFLFLANLYQSIHKSFPLLSKKEIKMENFSSTFWESFIKYYHFGFCSFLCGYNLEGGRMRALKISEDLHYLKKIDFKFYLCMLKIVVKYQPIDSKQK